MFWDASSTLVGVHERPALPVLALVAPDGIWLDPGSRLGPPVGSTGLPTTLFVDAQGRVVERHVGMLGAASLASRLRVLQAGAAAPPR